jgi:molecular chaperone DnaK
MSTPEQAGDKIVHMPVGIDLGTTYSAVSYIDRMGRPVCIRNDVGEILTPSAILFDNNDVVIGREAVRCSVTDPAVFAECFKRDVGSGFYRKEVNGVTVPPEVLSGMILERIKQDVVRELGSLEEAVITVPAFFDERRRRATQEAARLAGIQVLDIINEPTAAAIAYGFNEGLLKASASNQRSRILVYDLGGGTFDVTILEISERNFRALATDGDVQLGGRDFDQRIVDFLAQQFLDAHGMDPRSDPEDCAQLWLDAQQTKHSLSERSRINAVISHAGIRLRIEITREMLEQICADLLGRTESTTKLALKQAGYGWNDIDHVLVVGGSSRMPMVTEMLERISGKQVNRSLSPDEAIAQGAAIYAGILTLKNRGAEQLPFNLVNVNSHSLGIVGRNVQTQRPTVHVVIPKNTPLPHVERKQFPTAKEGQQRVVVQIVEGESSNPAHCSDLGTCMISDLPPGLPKGEKVIVQYRYEANGLIQVSAGIPSIRRSANVNINRDTAANLDSLDAWRKRIHQGESTNSAETAEAPVPKVADVPMPEDRQQQLARLDELYGDIGRLALAQPPVRKLRKTYQAAGTSAQVADQFRVQVVDLLSQQQDAVTSADRIRLSTEMAQTQEQLRTADNHAQHALILLGRELYQANKLPNECAEFRKEIERVQAILDEE